MTDVGTGSVPFLPSQDGLFRGWAIGEGGSVNGMVRMEEACGQLISLLLSMVLAEKFYYTVE